jgi:pilus assembly protein FimV
VATPATHAKPVWQAPQADTIVPLNAAPAGRERLELARAYLDMGDLATARSLLQEVAEGGDAEARAEAQRLLGGIA